MADQKNDPRTVDAVPRVKAGQDGFRVHSVAPRAQRTNPRHFKLRTSRNAYCGPFWGWWGRAERW